MQGVRYQIIEEIGCETSVVTSGVAFILVDMWHILLPSISLLFYSRKSIISPLRYLYLLIYSFSAFILWAIYRHRKESTEFIGSNRLVSTSDFYRLFALGCFDIVLTLPLGIINVVSSFLQGGPSAIPIQFYPGWTFIHTNWSPDFIPKKVWITYGFWDQFSVHWGEWINPLLALIFFALFGISKDTRTFYRHILQKVFRAPINSKDEASVIVFQSGNTQQTSADPSS